LPHLEAMMQQREAGFGPTGCCLRSHG